MSQSDRSDLSRTASSCSRYCAPVRLVGRTSASSSLTSRFSTSLPAFFWYSPSPSAGSRRLRRVRGAFDGRQVDHLFPVPDQNGCGRHFVQFHLRSGRHHRRTLHEDSPTGDPPEPLPSLDDVRRGLAAVGRRRLLLPHPGLGDGGTHQRQVRAVRVADSGHVQRLHADDVCLAFRHAAVVLLLRLLEHRRRHSSPEPRRRRLDGIGIGVDQQQPSDGRSRHQRSAEETAESNERRPYHGHHRRLFLHLLPALQSVKLTFSFHISPLHRRSSSSSVLICFSLHLSDVVSATRQQTPDIWRALNTTTVHHF